MNKDDLSQTTAPTEPEEVPTDVSLAPVDSDTTSVPVVAEAVSESTIDMPPMPLMATETSPAPAVEDSISPEPSVEQSVEPTPPVDTSSAEPVPVVVDQTLPAVEAQPVVAPQHHSDVLGIVSIVMAFTGLNLIGFILGLVGVSKAKKAGQSSKLSRIGWILNLIVLLLAVAFIALWVLVIAKDQTK